MRAFNIGPAVVTENAPKIASALSDGCCLSETLKRESETHAAPLSLFWHRTAACGGDGGVFCQPHSAPRACPRGSEVIPNDLVRYCAATGV